MFTFRSSVVPAVYKKQAVHNDFYLRSDSARFSTNIFVANSLGRENMASLSRQTDSALFSLVVFVTFDPRQDVVFIIRKNGSVEARTTAEKGRNADGPPLTILVDKGTASASEVFAAAVRYVILCCSRYQLLPSGGLLN